MNAVVMGILAIWAWLVASSLGGAMDNAEVRGEKRRVGTSIFVDFMAVLSFSLAMHAGYLGWQL